MKVGKLLHTRYRVNDLERTVKFYREILGLEESRRHKSPRGSELVFFKAPGSAEEIEICHFPGSEPVKVQPDLTHLAFAVDSLEAFGKHLAAHAGRNDSTGNLGRGRRGGDALGGRRMNKGREQAQQHQS